MSSMPVQSTTKNGLDYIHRVPELLLRCSTLSHASRVSLLTVILNLPMSKSTFFFYYREQDVNLDVRILF